LRVEANATFTGMTTGMTPPSAARAA